VGRLQKAETIFRDFMKKKAEENSLPPAYEEAEKN